MEIFNTEEQQVEAIKRFWKENGVAIIAGVVLGLGGLYGWRYYETTTLEKNMAQSNAYSILLEQSQTGTDNAELAKQLQTFAQANSGTPYAVLASLVAAKEAVAAKDYAAAIEAFNAVIATTEQKEIKALAQIRLARVQLENNDAAGALTTLSASMPRAFVAQQEELKGDALLASGDAAKAKSAYLAAQAAVQEGQYPVLKVKIDELAHITAA